MGFAASLNSTAFVLLFVINGLSGCTSGTGPDTDDIADSALCRWELTEDGDCVGDKDDDGINNQLDNCPAVPNPVQRDADADGEGDVCDDDDDNDGTDDGDDNCPFTENANQSDIDGDDLGDACDEDLDGDGFPNSVDVFETDPREWLDTDGDGVGDNADIEACDGLDNNGDGVIDEGFPLADYYPDLDGDGFYSGLPHSAQKSCAALFAGGEILDGVYLIDPGGPGGDDPIEVLCDMTTDGGGWTQVFFHDVDGGYFNAPADALETSVADPLADRYSILSRLEHFRSTWGGFEMRIDWPDAAEGRNIWRQTSNPTAELVAGYRPLSIDHDVKLWGGLELSDATKALTDGSVNDPSWYFAIGAYVPWMSAGGPTAGIPAFNSMPAQRVALWVRPDHSYEERIGTPITDCRPPPDTAETGGDCDDKMRDVNPYGIELCNGIDDDCDGEFEEGCPAGNVWVSEVPDVLHFYGRDLHTNTCGVNVSGQLTGAATMVRVTVLKDGVAYSSSSSSSMFFSITQSIAPELALYDIVIEWTDEGGFYRLVQEAHDIVCGDVILINGQSNAMAFDYHDVGGTNAETSTFVRSWGSSRQSASAQLYSGFNIAIAEAPYAEGSIGLWGLRLANNLKAEHELPYLVINGSVGATTVQEHQRWDTYPEDPDSIYGRLLWRVREAEVEDNVRAIFWHQGESDRQASFEAYLHQFTIMYDAWFDDYPNLDGIFPFQVRAGCGNPSWNRNVQRELPTLLPMVLDSMSTTGVDGHDGCHFYPEAYEEWGDRMSRVVSRDLYGSTPPGNIDAPNPVKATWISSTTLEIDFGDTGDGMTLQVGAEDYFSLADGMAIADVSVIDQTIVITTAGESAATSVSFVDVAGDIPWLVNDLGIGGFAFYEFPVTE